MSSLALVVLEVYCNIVLQRVATNISPRITTNCTGGCDTAFQDCRVSGSKGSDFDKTTEMRS